MSIVALGINHKSASLDVRERVAFLPEQMVAALNAACAAIGCSELVILSTCNRTELIFAYEGQHQEYTAAAPALKWLAEYRKVILDDLEHCSYVYVDLEAVRHLMHVASGLDSMILGEPQIFGQLKSSYAVAQEAETVGSSLSRVFQHVFSTAKKVRTDTAIGENPVSVAFAAVHLAKHIFAELSQSKALLIGAGETIELVARHLRDNGVQRILVANRTLGRAQSLAEQFNAEAIMLSEIPNRLEEADIVISSTGSQLPILGKGTVEDALKKRRHKPILMIDIAVPRDIESQVGELKDVYLYTIDDLKEVIDENLKSRQNEARRADEIINVGVEIFAQQLRSLTAVDVMKAFRRKAERYRDEELEKALRMLEKGENPQQVLAVLARALTNKLIHSPSIKLKEAGANGDKSMIEWSQQLLDLSEDEINQKEKS